MTSENILTDQCLAQSSSEKLPHAADENKRRGHSQKIFKVRDLETLSHARDVFKNSLLPELRKFYIREGKRIARGRRNIGHQGVKPFAGVCINQMLS